MEAILILALFGGFIGALGASFLLSQRHSSRPAFACPRVHIHGPAIPVRRYTLMFSRAERSFYRALRSMVPDHMIFVKVKVADLIPSAAKPSLWDHFSPINRKHVDFVVCDQTLAPVLAIELDDLTNPISSASRNSSVDSLLTNVALPVVHVPQKGKYLFNDLRRLLAPYLSVPRPIV
jgi:hypothetical protein